MTIKDIIPKIKAIKKENKTIVLATGVFDVIHQEHINFLEKAKNKADHLIVGIESDQRVKKMKGQDRPIFPQEQRLKNLQKQNLADSFFILPEEFNNSEDHKNITNLIRPDYLAVSSHTSFQDQKKKIIESCGGQLIIVHQHNPEISTTKAIKLNS